MMEFAAAFLVFIGAHVLPARSGLRDTLIGRLGRRAYLVLYSLLSLALLAWLISAATRAPHIALWPTTRLSVVIALVLTAIAAVLLSCGATRPQPVSISLRGGTIDPRHPGISALTRHPVLWALFLWSVAHLLANGDAVGVVMFASFAVFCVISRPALEARARRRLPEDVFAQAMSVSSGSFGDRLSRALSPRLAIETAAGLALYVLMLALHGDLIGVDPLAYF
ncbi:NnrU family protein [Hoeflea poritis]|uniref:NnrU family protein n=1 Tax=Hoeflea poritis TaxID=2993659 RepID=A0ABT4VR99_9HYPH|nr:NnrU family protein [Hoeflea poritis]MDA4847227.1 NnrU family protein [Hoeflea poritis]